MEERMEAYTTTYKLAQDQDEQNKTALYMKHREIIQTYLAESMLPQIIEKHDTHLIKEFVTRWDLFSILNKWMKAFFYYLDNFYVKHQNQLTLVDQGLKQFQIEIFDKVKVQVTSAILKVINCERNGEIVDANFDSSLLQRCIKIYRAMEPKEFTVYGESFENPYIDDAVAYYSRQSQQWLASDSTPEYLIKTENAIDLEARRVAAYFLPTTDPKIRKICAETLLKEQERTLLDKENSGILALLRQDKKR
jgi:cullin 1